MHIRQERMKCHVIRHVKATSQPRMETFFARKRTCTGHRPRSLSHIRNNGNAYGRNRSTIGNNSSVTEGAREKKDARERVPLPGVGQWRRGET